MGYSTFQTKMFFMKNLCFATIVSLLLIGCQGTENKTDTPKEETATTASVPAPGEFAYTIDQPVDNWSPGDLKHVVTVLKSLKAFENGDVEGSMTDFADSILLEFDQFEAKLSKDSASKMLKGQRDRFANVKIEMDDWESVISKDKKTQIVSLWYKQITTDKLGKVDSIQLMDDVRIENGKIASINEKGRRYAVKK